MKEVQGVVAGNWVAFGVLGGMVTGLVFGMMLYVVGFSLCAALRHTVPPFTMESIARQVMLGWVALIAISFACDTVSARGKKPTRLKNNPKP